MEGRESYRALSNWSAIVPAMFEDVACLQGGACLEVVSWDLGGTVWRCEVDV